jgi:DNA polymerase alpha-associated DNA helicase A
MMMLDAEQGEVGFLADERRLNVYVVISPSPFCSSRLSSLTSPDQPPPKPSRAMTRPRRQLVVVGDSSTVSKGSGYLKRWMEWLEENAWVQVPE